MNKKITVLPALALSLALAACGKPGGNSQAPEAPSPQLNPGAPATPAAPESPAPPANSYPQQAPNSSAEAYPPPDGAAPYQSYPPQDTSSEAYSEPPPITEVADEPPPPLPDYEQPDCPAPGYIWTPGYWGRGDEGYYWVPGTWVQPPQPGLYWTPGYWVAQDDSYGFHPGYWGPQVGYYGGINYGHGYGGRGYEGQPDGYSQYLQFHGDQCHHRQFQLQRRPRRHLGSTEPAGTGHLARATLRADQYAEAASGWGNRQSLAGGLAESRQAADRGHAVAGHFRGAPLCAGRRRAAEFRTRGLR